MIAVVVLLIAVAWTYGRTLTGLVAEWASSPDASYGVVLAAVAIGVIWRRRQAFVVAIDPAAPRTLPSCALAAGAALFVVGQLGADLFLTRVSLVVVLAAAVWFLAGEAALRTIAAAFVFLAIAIPLPALVVNAITVPLQLVASRIAESTLAVAGVPVFRDGNVLALPSATLEVAEACSGMRSLVSLVAIGTLFAWLMDAAFVRRAAIVALAIPIAVGVNGLRIAATGMACESFGPRAASGAWHEFTGWIAFIASVAVLGAIQRFVDPRRAAAAPADALPAPI